MLMLYGLLRYRQKLHLSSLNHFSVFGVMPVGQRSIVWATVVTKTINNFWASTDQHIDAQHVPEWYKNTRGNMCQPTETEKTVKRVFPVLAETGVHTHCCYIIHISDIQYVQFILFESQ